MEGEEIGKFGKHLGNEDKPLDEGVIGEDGSDVILGGDTGGEGGEDPAASVRIGVDDGPAWEGCAEGSALES